MLNRIRLEIEEVSTALVLSKDFFISEGFCSCQVPPTFIVPNLIQ